MPKDQWLLYGFHSQKEWETYCLCLHKATKGDRIFIYVSGRLLSRGISNLTIGGVIDRIENGNKTIKNLNPPDLLMATNDRSLEKYGFYLLSRNGYTSNYLYGYWIYPYDVRVAKIIKA